MDVGFDKAKLLHYKALAEEHLGDPVRLRLAVVAALAAVALGGIYLPFSKRIEQVRGQLAAEHDRCDNITGVEKLRKQAESYRSRIGQQSDTNEWVQYILGGLRQLQVKLRDMESKKPRRVGPYRAVTLSLELEGSYSRLKSFLEWLEQSDRLVRVDSVRLEKQRSSLVMKIVVLGLMRKDASEA